MNQGNKARLEKVGSALILTMLQAERSKLDEAIQILSGGEPIKATVLPIRHRRKMSAAARKAISRAQKKRWAKRKSA